METLKADSFQVLERQTIYTHPQTQAQTHCVKIERKRQAEVLSLSQALDMAERYQGKLVVNERSGRVAIAVPTNSTVTDDGAIVRRVNLIRPTSSEKVNADQFRASTWQEVGQEKFQKLWQQEVGKAPEFEVDSPGCCSPSGIGWRLRICGYFACKPIVARSCWGGLSTRRISLPSIATWASPRLPN